MMITNDFALEGCQSGPAGGLSPGGRAQREGCQSAGAGPGPAQFPPDSAGRLSAGSVGDLSTGHHVLEVRLAPS